MIENVIPATERQSKGFANAMLRQLFFDKVMALPAPQLITALSEAGIRRQVGETPVAPNAVLVGHNGLSAVRVLNGMRLDLALFLADQDQPVRRRVRYFFQTQMLPREMREKLTSRAALTFLPGGTEEEFPADAKFWDVERLEAATMGVRVDQPRDARNSRLTTHYDFRVHTCEVDREFGRIVLGGKSLNSQNQLLDRCSVHSSLAFETGTHPDSLDETRYDYFDQSLEMLEQLEMAEASKTDGQLIPKLPAIFLAFTKDKTLTPEPSPGLKAKAYASVRAWLRAGSPVVTDNPQFSWAAAMDGGLIGHCPHSLSGWEAIERAAGPKDANNILIQTYMRNCEQYEDQLLVPSQFFMTDSMQRPFRYASRFLVNVEPFLGRMSYNFDGTKEQRPGIAKIQQLSLVEPAVMPFGEVGSWEYNFGG